MTTNNPGSDPSKAIIPDHALGGGFLPTIHTRYLIDAGAVMCGVGLFVVALFLIAEPDVSALLRKFGPTALTAAAV